MSKGVAIEELRLGEGAEAHRDTTVRVRYDLYLNRGDVVQRGLEYTIDLSQRRVIAGLRYGIEGMREGGRRRLRVGPHLAYGERGVTGVPPHAVLLFEVELLQVTPNQPATEPLPAVPYTVGERG